MRVWRVRPRRDAMASAYRSPVDVAVAQLLQSLPQHSELRTLAFRVGVYYLLRLVTCQLDELTVACDVRNLQVECPPDRPDRAV